MEHTLRVLIIEDSEDDAILMTRLLKKGGYKLVWRRIANAESLISALDEPWDIILSDYSMPGFDGRSALEIVKNKGMDIPFIVISGFLIEENAVEILKAGAGDFVAKGQWARFVPAIERELREAEERREKQKAKKAKEEAEARYRSLFEHMNEGVYQSTPEGHFIVANPAMARILGYDSSDELIQKTAKINEHLFVNLNEQHEFFRYLKQTGSVNGFEAQMFRKNRAKIWVSIHSHAIRNNEGDVELIEGWVEDISERRQAEEELKKYREHLEKMVALRTSELKSANEELQKAKEIADAATRAKSEFLANMSHEIRTPMNGVISAAELIMNEELSPKVNKYLQIIHTSAYSLLGVINDILDFSKIEAGQLVEEKAPFLLNELLDNIISIFISKASEKRIELLLDMDTDIPIDLIGDSLRLQQILTNLIGNAIKFTDQGGSVTIGVKNISNLKDEVKLQFSIEDTGIGINDEQIDKLFKPFSQADASITRKYGGTGLGLTICKQLVKMMGGEIWVKSELNKGSSFFFILNLKRQSQDSTRFVMVKDLAGLKVLLLDNSSKSGLITKKILNSFGFRVDFVTSSSMLLDLLKQKVSSKDPFQLIIFQRFMSEMDGLELSKEIRFGLKVTTPIIIICDYGKEVDTYDHETSDINGFLLKPLSASAIYNLIMDVFGKETSKILKPKKELIKNASAYKNELAGLNILVAEDNATNQAVVSAILKLVGIKAKIAKDGNEALELFKKNIFDAILMDVQMPEMDGFEATRLIRKFEAEIGDSHIPIIAMTAHAMKGDEEKCLQAGMDAYVSKPINHNIFFKTLANTIKLEKQKVIPENFLIEDVDKLSEEPLPELPGINVRTAMVALNFDWKTFQEILIRFMHSNKNTMTNIYLSLEQKKWDVLKNIAHGLKGSGSNIGAYDLEQVAKNLEMANIFDSTLIDAVEKELNKVIQSIQQLEESKNFDIPLSESKINQKLFSKTIIQLIEAIEYCDPVMSKQYFKILKYNIDDPSIQTLEKYLSNYDFDQALEIAQRFS
ncbi:MAG: response regulator [Desulfobacterales bacterium]|nr:response regulator [Desulfobacterales bacterium]